MTGWINKPKKGIKIAALIVLMAGYACYMFLSFARIPINSDFAALVLEANDVIGGNVFLGGWNLTGATFAFTEVLFYSIGTLLFGIDVKAYILAVTLMYILMFVIGILLLKQKDDRFWFSGLLLFFAVAGFPGTYWAENLRAHTGVFVFCFAAILCLQNLFETERKWLFFAYLLLVALGSMSDMFMIPVCCIPVLILCGFNLLSNQNGQRKLNWLILGSTAAGLILGKIFSEAYLWIGGVNENSLTGVASFSTLEQIPEQFLFFVSCLLKIFGCDFAGTKIFSISTVWNFLCIWILFYGFSVVLHTLKSFFLRKSVNQIDVILSLGIVIHSVFLIITPFMSGLHSARYFSFLPISFAVLIIRNFQQKQVFSLKLANRRLPANLLIAVYCILLLIGSVRPVSFSRAVSGQDRLATFLREQGLTYGYGDFWTANAVTVTSENRVKIRALSFEAIDSVQQPYAYLWFSKTGWYHPEYANFVVIGSTGFKEVTEENVNKFFGEPVKKLVFEDYGIYIYDQDISGKIIL
ncbi:MAG: hypothetical protein AB9907_15655 [Flexilinea sp.]